MSRMSYKTALRAKGIKPIPAPRVLRSSLTVEGEHIVTPLRRVGKSPLLAVSYGKHCVEEGDIYCNHDHRCALTELGL